MKTKSLIPIILALSLLIGACERPVKAKEHKAITAQIDAYMAELFNDAEKLQTTALEKYLDDGPTARFYMGARMYRKAALLQEIKKTYADYTSQKLVVIEPRSYVVSRKGVVWTAQVSSLATDKDGLEHPNALSETWLWQKNGEYWQVSHFSEAWVNK